jgi:protein subunit release factor A
MMEDVMGVFIEIRAAEGGDDAKLLVQKQLKIYGRVAARRGL